jgi:hypothetical protein
MPKSSGSGNGEPEAYDSYPWSSMLAYNLVMLANYLAGLYIVFRIGLVLGMLYLVYLVIMEFSVYREGCINCFYYGKRCVAGKGLVAGKLFRRGNPRRFCEKKVTVKSLIPQMAIVAVPLAGGAWLLWTGFEWLILGLMMVPVLTWFIGNPLVYGKLACPHCRQGRICCPVNDFFGKKVKK